MIFFNGNFHTVNERQPRAECIVVKGSRIVFVGSNSGAMKFGNASTPTVDLRGATVVPGMTDSHYHLVGVGEREMRLNLEGTTSLEDFLNRVRVHVDQVPLGTWVTGRGWSETVWKPPVFPTRSELDRVAPNNPLLLTRVDSHSAIANSAALKIAGINLATSDPFGGEILREPHTHQATGMLLDSAQELVMQHIPPPSRSDTEAAILLGAKRSIELGWCQVHNAGSRFSEIDLIRKLYEETRIKLRIYNAVYAPGSDVDRFLREGSTVNAYGHCFTMRTIKVLLDGSLGSRSAALLEPYSDAETSGFLTARETDLLPIFKEALRRGIQVETHAIGDRANRSILDLYEQVFKGVPEAERKVTQPRWRVEHAQILDLADIPRFARLGVIPSMQPSHAVSDQPFVASRLGVRRLSGAYAWQSLIRSGAIIAGGSDAPVERGDPMIEFHAAVAPKSLLEFSREEGPAEQAVSREQALRMFTLWAAIAAFEERDKGSIEVGKLADLTVLSADIMTIPEAEILDTHCLMTVIGGEIVHEAPGLRG